MLRAPTQRPMLLNGCRLSEALRGLMVGMVDSGVRARGNWSQRVRSDRAADGAFVAAVAIAVVVYYFAGRHQWFVRDDWDYVIGRDALRRQRGAMHWLLEPQAGHWLTVPILIFHVIKQWFGLRSYWPFLLPTMTAHVGAVLLVRTVCRRSSISAWTTTLICTVLLVFGAGWENMIFAIQISFNLSLVVFLAQIVLVDHDGPVDRRDYLASAIAFIGLMSSGFGTIFMFGIVILLAARRRWLALLVVVGPQCVAATWWYLWWETDGAAQPGNAWQLPIFVVRGLVTTFDGLAGIAGFGTLALVATLATTLARRSDRRVNTLYAALGATTLIMFTAIGKERVGLGTAFATSSRYAHVAAFVIAPVFAGAIDQLARISRNTRRAGLILLSASAAVNLSGLSRLSVEWAEQTRVQRNTYDLVAGSGLASQVQHDVAFFPESAAVHLDNLPELVALGAVTPRRPDTLAEIQLVRTALGLPDV